MLVTSRTAKIALILLALCADGEALAFDLVTAAEFERERQAEAHPTRAMPAPPRGLSPGAPLIEIRQPTQLDGVKAPFTIQLGFKVSDGAEVDLKSFRVLYGLLKLDITNRLLEKARLSTEGLMLTDAAIPSGSHRLRIELKDNKGRETDLDVTIKVL